MSKERASVLIVTIAAVTALVITGHEDAAEYLILLGFFIIWLS